MKPTIVIAGGGTGGHVFPGLAVADALRALADVEVVFCGTARGLESRAVPMRGFRLETLNIEPIKGGGYRRALRGGFVALQATLQALRTLRRLRPRAVLSVGGYASGPVTLAAGMTGVPVAVLEPNSTAGLANRIVGPLARRAYIAFDGSSAAFRKRALRRYGVPVLRAPVTAPYVASEAARVLVMGGSQGSAALNERMPLAMAQVATTLPAVQVVHQAGHNRDGQVREAYGRANLAGVTVVPFIEDVAGAMAGADVVVARAGAITLAEIALVGRAAILVPFPHASDDHQMKNAQEHARSGAAVVLSQADADVGRLAQEIVRLLGDADARVRMAAASRARAKPTASRDVAVDLLDLAGIARAQGAS